MANWRIEKKSDGIIGIPTGFIDLDRKLGGLRKGGLHILSGATCMGKRLWTIGRAKHVAMKEKTCSLYLT